MISLSLAMNPYWSPVSWWVLAGEDALPMVVTNGQCGGIVYGLSYGETLGKIE
jgi:hypothetical protein